MATAEAFLDESPATDAVKADAFLDTPPPIDTESPYGGRGAGLREPQVQPPKDLPGADIPSNQPLPAGIMSRVGGAITAAEDFLGSVASTVGNIPANVYNTGSEMTHAYPPVELPFQKGKAILPKGAGDLLEALAGGSPDNPMYAPSGAPDVVQGFAKATRKAVEGFTTPEGLATLPLFEFKAGRAALLGIQASQTPASFANTAKVLSDPKSTGVQKWEALGSTGINLAMTAGLALSLRPEEVQARYTPEEAAKVVEPPQEKDEFGLTMESVQEQKDREANELEARAAASKKQALADRAAKPLIGSVGDIGQTDFAGGNDLFSAPPSNVGPGMGGAIPSEFEKSPQTPTGIKNATVDAERAQRGLPPAVQPARKAFGEVWDRAMAKVDQDPAVIDTLMDELRHKPRALTDEEDALLLHRQIDLQNDYGKATRDLAQAFEDGDEGRREESNVRVARISDQLLDLYNVGKRVGTETGRGLNARKMMAYEDFSLASMELEKRSANGGRELTTDERAEIKTLHDKIDKLQKAYDEHTAATQDRIRQLETDKALAEAKAGASKETIHPKIIEAARKIVGKIDKRADVARGRLKDRLSRVSSGVDPTILVDLAEIGASHLAHGALDFAEWSIKMAGDLGEFADRFKDNMREIFEASQKRLEKDTAENPLELARAMRQRPPEEQIKANADKIAEKLKANQKGDVTWHVQRIARLLVQSGVTDREVLIDHIHDILKQSLPDITRRETMDAISGYGDFKQLSKDDVSLKLRGMKGEMQQIAKLEDMQAGTPPLKSGVERRTPTDVERELIKKVNDAKNRFKVPMTDAATQLKSALDTVKTRLRNQITDLERQISARQKTVKEKAPVPTDAQAEALKSKRDAVKADYDKLFNDPEEAYRQALKEYKNRTQKRIADYEDRIARGDYSKKSKNELVLDREAMKLKADAERVKKQYQEGLLRDRLKQRTPWEKTMDTIAKWRRGFILSGPVTLAKLTAAAVARMITTPLEEGVGAGLSKIPFIKEVSAKAPREGGANLKAEVRAITKGLSEGAKDAWQTLTTGHSELERLYGKRLSAPQSFIDIFGNIHGALKSTTKRAEWERSMEKRGEYYARQGVDITDPVIQSRIGIEAYQDAEKSIFMQRNWLADKVNGFIKARVDKTGHAPAGQKAFETAGRVLFPIVRVPTNIVSETMQYAFGLATGNVKLAKAFSKGIETLKLEEADLIMRHLKKGSLGAAVMLTGYFLPDVFGGYYQQGEKRKKTDIPPDATRVGGVNIPSYYTHNPLVGTAQLGSTVRRVAESKLRKSDKDKQGLTAGMLAGAIGLADATPFVRETTEISKLMNTHERGQWLGEMAKSLLVPQALQSLAQYTDKDAQGNPIKRKPTSIPQAIESGIPGLRKDVPKAKK